MRTVFALRRPQKERSLRWLSSQKSPGGKIVTFEQVEESTQNGVRNDEPRMGYIRTAAGHAGSTGKLPSHLPDSPHVVPDLHTNTQVSMSEVQPPEVLTAMPVPDMLTSREISTVACSPVTRNTIRHANSDLVTVVEGVGDFWAAHIHEGGLITIRQKVPKNQYQGDFGLIGEGESVGPIITDPDVAIADIFIRSLTGHANASHVLTVGAVEAKSEITAVEITALHTTPGRTVTNTIHQYVF
ncbi:hypothetical protein VB005_02478 [Metarhizium brunneum]